MMGWAHGPLLEILKFSQVFINKKNSTIPPKLVFQKENRD